MFGIAVNSVKQKIDKKEVPTSSMTMKSKIPDLELSNKSQSSDQLPTLILPVLLTKNKLSERDRIYQLAKLKNRSKNLRWNGTKKSKLCFGYKCQQLEMLPNQVSSNSSNLLEISTKSEVSSPLQEEIKINSAECHSTQPLNLHIQSMSITDKTQICAFL